MNVKRQASELQDSAAQAAEFLRLMANAHRLAILCALIEGPRSVGELCAILGTSQPNISQHLAKLRTQQLVTSRRQGTTIRYSLLSRDAAAIIAILHRSFCASPPTRARRAA